MTLRKPQDHKLTPENREKYIRLKKEWASLQKDVYEKLATRKGKEVEKIKTKLEKAKSDSRQAEKEIQKIQQNIQVKSALLRVKSNNRETKPMKPVEKDEHGNIIDWGDMKDLEPITIEEIRKADPARADALEKSGVDSTKSEFGKIDDHKGNE